MDKRIMARMRIETRTTTQQRRRKVRKRIPVTMGWRRQWSGIGWLLLFGIWTKYWYIVQGRFVVPGSRNYLVIRKSGARTEGPSNHIGEASIPISAWNNVPTCNQLLLPTHNQKQRDRN